MTNGEILIRLGLSVLIGSIIGLEREYRGKSAGLRTIILITTGAAVFTMISELMTNGSPDRIASNIVTGVGFLGAGVIFRDHRSVSGLTTAASVWAAAGLGMAAGGGYYIIAGAGCIILIVVLLLFLPLQKVIDAFNHVQTYKFTCVYHDNVISQYLTLFKSEKLKVVRKDFHKEDSQITFTLVTQGTEKNHERLVKQLLQDKAVTNLHF
ncbi:MAG: MgtC/SapB family protein [Chitinophagaceae bacterium]